MRVLITGICGFAGSTLARELRAHAPGIALWGIDNFSRPGSELNQIPLEGLGVKIRRGDIRFPEDLAALPRVDFIIDAAAQPSVLAGLGRAEASRELIDHNLFGTVNLLEKCKADGAGFILLSTSRVYGIDGLRQIPLQVDNEAYVPDAAALLASPVRGLTAAGICETFPTTAPISLYGSTKLASETLALEYGLTFDFPVYVNRCGVLAGAGQFGRADQGIFSFWLHSFHARRPLRYLGFGGHGHQVRDCLHPRDLLSVLRRQMSQSSPMPVADRVLNFAGGTTSAYSLAQLSAWCTDRFGAHKIAGEAAERPFDLPWVVLDASRAQEVWDWRPITALETILEEIAEFAESHPDWLTHTQG